MADRNSARLRLLAAEIRGELRRVEKTAVEIEAAQAIIGQADAPRLSLYGAAALLETFYSGVEKVLTRVASAMGISPEGPAWHRRLLDDATLDLPKIRPPLMGQETAKLLEPYLAFRHRFRNLYLFDLEQQLIAPLLAGVSDAQKATSRDLLAFCYELEQIADSLEE